MALSLYSLPRFWYHAVLSASSFHLLLEPSTPSNTLRPIDHPLYPAYSFLPVFPLILISLSQFLYLFLPSVHCTFPLLSPLSYSPPRSLPHPPLLQTHHFSSLLPLPWCVLLSFSLHHRRLHQPRHQGSLDPRNGHSLFPQPLFQL